MKRHPLEVLSLLSGLLFIGFALLYLGADVNDLVPSAAITIPILLAGLGVAGILAAIVASNRAAGEAPLPERVGGSWTEPQESSSDPARADTEPDHGNIDAAAPAEPIRSTEFLQQPGPEKDEGSIR